MEGEVFPGNPRRARCFQPVRGHLSLPKKGCVTAERYGFINQRHFHCPFTATQLLRLSLADSSLIHLPGEGGDAPLLPARPAEAAATAARFRCHGCVCRRGSAPVLGRVFRLGKNFAPAKCPKERRRVCVAPRRDPRPGSCGSSRPLRQGGIPACPKNTGLKPARAPGGRVPAACSPKHPPGGNAAAQGAGRLRIATGHP